VSGVMVELPYPVGAALLSQSLITGPFVNNSCNGNSQCVAGETGTWSLGTLDAGRAVTLTLPPETNSQAGELVRWKARLTEDSGTLLTETATLPIVAAPVLRLAIDESRDPVPAGETIAYTLRYGNRSGGNGTGTSLAFTLPADASFVSASGGVTPVGGTVTWPLATLATGATGQQRVVAKAGAGLATGALLESSAVISGTSNALPTEGRTGSAAYVSSAPPLTFQLNVNPQPASSSQAIQVAMTVTNPNAFPVSGAMVSLRYPIGATLINESAITGPFVSNSCNGNSQCSSGEVATWNLGTLAPGDAVTMTLPPGTNSQNGELVRWHAQLTEDSGTLRLKSLSLPIGLCSGSDGDGDNICNVFDNCTAVANPSQRDTDGDGIGNSCDADLNNSGGPVNFADLALFRSVFGVSGTRLSEDADLNDSGGVVNFADLAIFRLLFGSPPGP